MQQIVFVLSVLCIVPLTSASKPAIATTATQVSSSDHSTIFPPVPGENLIRFDREMMYKNPRYPESGFSEGEWRTRVMQTFYGPEECCLKIKHKYGQKVEDLEQQRDKPFPLAGNPWPGQQEFLAKLKLIELFAWNQDLLGNIGFDTGSDCYEVISPIDGEELSGARLWDMQNHNISWRPDYSTHFCEKYCIKPSRQFYRYIHARAAQLGAVTMEDTKRIMAESLIKRNGALFAHALLPWKDPVKQEQLVKTLAPLFTPYEKYFNDDSRNPPPDGWFQGIRQQVETLAPELFGDKVSYWLKAFERNRTLKRRYLWLGELCYELKSERWDIGHARYDTKQELAALYRDYK